MHATVFLAIAPVNGGRDKSYMINMSDLEYFLDWNEVGTSKAVTLTDPDYNPL